MKKKLSPAGKILISFLSIAIIGCFLLCLPISHNDGKWFSFIDGLFTSVSAVCVTGLTVIDVTANLTVFGKIVLMMLIQIGGLGFITINSLLFLILGKKITFEKRLTIKETFNQESVQGMVKLVKKILIFVFITEFIGAVCFLPTFINIYGFWKGLFNSVFMSISSFCNAGFDVLGSKGNYFESLLKFNNKPLVLLPVMTLTVLGGIGFIVIFELPKLFKKEKISLHSKITLFLTLILIVVGSLLFSILEWNNPSTIGNLSVKDKILNSIFLSVTPRTVGFSTVNMQGLTNGSIVLTMLLMFVGAGSASTAGGLKLTTLFLILLLIFKNANSNGELVFNKQQIGAKATKKAIKVFSLYIFLVLISTLIICCFENTSIGKTMFECISALSTVGLSLGLTTTFSIIGKIVLIILMLFGRGGMITISVVVLKSEDDKPQVNIKYPDAKILVG